MSPLDERDIVPLRPVNPEEAERRALENLKTHARRVAKEAREGVYKPGGMVGAAIEWVAAEAAVPPAETRERIMRAALETLAMRGHGCTGGSNCDACVSCVAGNALNAADLQDPSLRYGG